MREGVPLDERKGGITEDRRAPYHLSPGTIAIVVCVAMACLAGGYLSLMWAFFHGGLADGWPMSILGLHTVGLVAVLMAFFGRTVKVTPTSASTS
jgi:hypothetical protein